MSILLGNVKRLWAVGTLPFYFICLTIMKDTIWKTVRTIKELLIPRHDPSIAQDASRGRADRQKESI
jgi:hypothetical protein